MHNKKFDSPFFLNDVAIDPIANLVNKDGQEQEVTPKVVQILQHLAASDGELVTYQNLADNVWNGFVSESALYQQMTQLRKVLGDNPNKPRFVKTVPRQGYRLIAEVRSSTDSVQAHTNAAVDASTSTASTSATAPSSSSATPPLNRHIKTISIGALAFAAIVALSFWQFYSPNIDSLNQHLTAPKRTIALQVFNRQERREQPQLLAAVERLTEYHLSQLTDQYVLRTPGFDNDYFYERLNLHSQKSAPLAYIIKPRAQQIEQQTLIAIDIFDATGQQIISSINGRLSHNQESDLNTLEKNLMAELKRLNLIPDNAQSTLGETGNKALVQALSPWSGGRPNRDSIEQSMIDAEQAIAQNPNNQMAYGVLFSATSWLLNSFDGDFDIDRTLAKLNNRADQALQKFPESFAAQYAKASYHCWLDELQQCHNWLGKALEQRPSDARLLRTLNRYQRKNNINPLTLAQYNYQLHPFTGNSLYYLRNVLVKNGRLNDAVDLITQHKFRKQWENWGPVWRLEAQKPVTTNRLASSDHWYQEFTHTNSLETPTQPSNYLAFSLLDANKPELSRLWLKQGRKPQSQHFDLESLSLIIDIWQDKWQPSLWRTVKDRAENQANYINPIDRLRIALFDYYAGHMNEAAKSIEQIFPELAGDFSDQSITINANNIRFAIYYAEIAKRQGDYKRATHLNQNIRQFLQGLGDEPNRNGAFGISDVEFYALNSDDDRALKRLEQAINSGWLPSSYWFWLPIERSPFLTSLHPKAEFKALREQLSQKYQNLCFDCSQP